MKISHEHRNYPLSYNNKRVEQMKNRHHHNQAHKWNANRMFQIESKTESYLNHESERNDVTFSNNIMFDSRVVRGNTFASPVITAEQRRNWETFERNQHTRQLQYQHKNKTKHNKKNNRVRCAGKLFFIIVLLVFYTIFILKILFIVVVLICEMKLNLNFKIN